MNTETAIGAPATIDEGYETVKNLIYHQVHKFFERYGGDFDELLAEANLAFVQGHRQFIEDAAASKPTGTYHSTIRNWVWYEMFEQMRTRLRRGSIVQISEFFDDTTKTNPWDTGIFVAELSNDARYAVMLVLDPPEEIKRVAEAKGGEPRNYRSTVRVHLEEDLGWKEGRIAAAFMEIREAL